MPINAVQRVPSCGHRPSNIVLGAEGSTAETPSGQVPGKISTKPVRVLHRSIAYQADFGRFTESLERILGHKPPDVEEQFAGQPRLAEDRLKAAEGAQELMIFTVFNHGAALNVITAPRNAKQYLIGNPLTAIRMDQHDTGRHVATSGLARFCKRRLWTGHSSGD
jgi:hypothetical protein